MAATMNQEEHKMKATLDRPAEYITPRTKGAIAAINRRTWLTLSLAAGLLGRADGAHAQSDPLPSWNQGPTKKSITDFVARATAQGSKDYVSPAERIAVFDNDGTLWT